MQLVEWKDEYSVGDPLMDAHHRMFFEMFRELYNALESGKQDIDIAGILDFLIEYIEMHLKSEERLLEKVGYPKINEHRTAHNELTRQAIEINQSFTEDNALLDKEKLLAFLQNWFFVHIIQEDMKYKAYV